MVGHDHHATSPGSPLLYTILTVCTGNICRSPLAALVLRDRLPGQPMVVSAGTRARRGDPMTPEAAQIAGQLGVPAEASAAHRSRLLGEGDLLEPALILAMTRAHRRAIVELAPARLRSTFTVREFARLARLVPEETILAAASAGDSEDDRVRRAAAAVAQARGQGEHPANAEDDDVVDPFGRSWATYQLSATQLSPALDEVIRVMNIALSRA